MRGATQLALQHCGANWLATDRIFFAEDVGNFDKDEANDVFELILDLREKQTLFTPLIHKELFLSRLKENLSKATYNKDWKKNGKPAIIPYGRDTDDASADDGDAAD